jgi:rhamnopyranosyl-N-acetylglucosaminyl-diphospho-decaprenol beta-1,3/1,4-galactofuranosyltransferase
MTERVCAVLVTYNRAALVSRSLRALAAQTRTVDHVIVVDNASTDDTAAVIARDFPAVTLWTLPSNIGGAGGFHEGIGRAFAEGYDWIWLMDDDAEAEPACLERLLARRNGAEVSVPLQRDNIGRIYGVHRWVGRGIDVTSQVVAGVLPLTGDYLFAFVGPLLSRHIVEAIGLPQKDFFIWFDDWEYGMRILRTGAKVTIVPDALLNHDVGGGARQFRFLGRSIVRTSPAPWKIYYGTRNVLHTLRTGRHPLREFAMYFASQAKAFIEDALFEPDRGARLRMRGLGIMHGATGRMGKRV